MSKAIKFRFYSKILDKFVFMITMFITALSGWVFGLSNTTIAETTKPFDHSNCQYPNRLSNPPNGCDNSDPARPECVTKFGTEDCDIPYPEPLEIVETPIVVTPIELELTTVDSCK
jgi:hypothetical protein